MNLTLWLLIGGLIGGSYSWLFGSSLSLVIVDFLSAIIGSVIFGLIASDYMPSTPIFDLDQQSFSPGALFLASVGALIVLIVVNLFY